LVSVGPTSSPGCERRALVLLVYILTRPLGANLGDWSGFPTAERGLGLGTAVTSVIFLMAIVATVVYLTLTRADVITDADDAPHGRAQTNTTRERLLLGYFAAVAVATGIVLSWASAQPHAAARPAAGGYKAATSAGEISTGLGWTATVVATLVSLVVAYASIA